MMNIDHNEIVKLAQKYDLLMVVLFGSQATGKTHKESDVDIAYAGGRPFTLKEEGALIVDLMPVVHSRAVDIVNIHKASPLLLREIVREGTVLYEKIPSAFFSLYAYALRTYEEARPLFELRSAYLKNRAAHVKVS